VAHAASQKQITNLWNGTYAEQGVGDGVERELGRNHWGGVTVSFVFKCQLQRDRGMACRFVWDLREEVIRRA